MKTYFRKSGLNLLLCAPLFLAISCGPAETQEAESFDAATTAQEPIALPDNAATEMDQPGIERPPVPADSLAEGEGSRPIGTSRP